MLVCCPPVPLPAVVQAVPTIDSVADAAGHLAGIGSVLLGKNATQLQSTFNQGLDASLAWAKADKTVMKALFACLAKSDSMTAQKQRVEMLLALVATTNAEVAACMASNVATASQ